MGRSGILLAFALLVSCVQLNAAARHSTRSTRGRQRGSGIMVVTDDTRESNNPRTFSRIDDVPAIVETTPAPAPIFKEWLELETVPAAKTGAKLHGEVVLECVAVGSPPPSIFWLKNDIPIEATLTFHSEEIMNGVEYTPPPFRPMNPTGFAMSKVKSKLPIRCIRPEDEGKYTCVADNDGRELTSSTTVVIEEDDRSLDWKPECEFRLPLAAFLGKKGRRGTPAYIHVSESIHMEAIGNDILIPCRAGGKPKPRITWTNTDGHMLSAGKKFQINGRGDLIIKNLSWAEMGEYTCGAENQYGSESAATFLYPLLVSATSSVKHPFSYSPQPWAPRAWRTLPSTTPTTPTT